MTRLYILRHAKAASSLPGMRDFDRPLDAVGQLAAGELGKKLAQLDITLDAIICSPSLRTRQTLDEIKPFLQKNPQIGFEQDIYSGELDSYLALIRATNARGSLMIVGHNPSCEDIVHQLVGSGEKQALRKLLDGFAPGTLAVIDFEVPFAEIEPKTGYLESLLLDACTTR
jgi:phosphohistidine phosphatase